MERDLKSLRTNYPAELRAAGFELVLTLMAQHRCEFDLRAADFSLRREKINVIAILNGQSSQHTIDALPTHDGYFSIVIPLGNNAYQIGIQFGLSYKWVQIEAAEILPIAALYATNESEHTQDASPNLAMDQMIDKGDGLFECLSPSGLIAYIPTIGSHKGNCGLRIVFRPISRRDKN